MSIKNDENIDTLTHHALASINTNTSNKVITNEATFSKVVSTVKLAISLTTTGRRGYSLANT